MRLVLLLIGLGGVVVTMVGCAAEPSAEGATTAPMVELAKQEQELSLLCGSSAQCNDGNACTLDLCVAGICIHGPDLGCCQQDSDCHTDAVCSLVSCVLNTCVESPIVGCGDMSSDGSTDEQLGLLCGSDDDCVDSDPCTDNICLIGGVCLFTPNPLCCDEDTDCSGLVACHDGECTNNRCALTLDPLCFSPGTDDTVPSNEDSGTINVLCGSDDDCEDGDPCTDNVCLVGGACVFASSPLCCDEASDCDGVSACHTGECLNHRCSLTPLAGCSQEGDTGEAAAGATMDGSHTGAADHSSTSGDATVVPDPQGTTFASGAISEVGTSTTAPDTDDDSVTAEGASSAVTNSDVTTAAPSTGDDTRRPWNSWATPFTGDTASAGVTGPDGVPSDLTPTSEGKGNGATTDDEVTSEGEDSAPSSPIMARELTGGACSVVAPGSGARPGYWLALGLVAFAARRRRK